MQVVSRFVPEVNPKIKKWTRTKWVDEIHENLDELVARVKKHKENETVFFGLSRKCGRSLGKFEQENLKIDIGSDQTSLHNLWAGGYYPVGISF